MGVRREGGGSHDMVFLFSRKINFRVCMPRYVVYTCALISFSFFCLSRYQRPSFSLSSLLSRVIQEQKTRPASSN